MSELLALPYLRSGPLAREWSVRARTYDRFLARVVGPLAGNAASRPLAVLDLGAGNGWLCYRMAREGHQPLALDWRRDQVDGLGAAAPYRTALPAMFPRVAASFQALPLRNKRFDLVVYNAAIHYADDLSQTISEAARVTVSGGRIVILDSPFYRNTADGERMLAEKRKTFSGDLLSIGSIEFLTPDRLAAVSRPLNLIWRRHRVRYPVWYELRPLLARLRGRRSPSRFDLWEAAVP